MTITYEFHNPIYSLENQNLQPPAPPQPIDAGPLHRRDNTAESLDIRALHLQEFFKRYQCPEFNYGLIDHYVDAADTYQIPYSLLPAISLQESSCGKRYPNRTNNLWGWNGARSGFDSIPSGIDFVSEKLANGRYYAGKTLDKKLYAYNPYEGYILKIKRFMAQIEQPQ